MVRPSASFRSISSSPPSRRPEWVSSAVSVVVTPICQSTSTPPNASMKPEKLAAMLSCSSNIEQELSTTISTSTVFRRTCWNTSFAVRSV